MKIAEVDFKGKGELQMLNVTAVAPTLGWTNVELSKVQYVNEPVDGIQDFILNATPPRGIAATAIELFPFSMPVEPKSWFKGIRIRNSNNEPILTLRNPVKNAKSVGSADLWVEKCGFRKDHLVMETTCIGSTSQQHTFQLAWDGQIRESFPVQVTLELSHNLNKDSGKAILHDTLQFDLSTLEGFPEQKMEIHLKTPCNDVILYYCPTTCKTDEVVMTNNFRKSTTTVLT